MNITNNHVVTFSGGRTSAYLVWLFEQKRKREKINVEYIYCDTGAEHPGTYKFIKQVVDNWGINLTCLRALVSPEKGIGTTYKVVTLDDCKPDLVPFRDVCLKYGTPHPAAPGCTDEMKSTPSDKYCNDKYGRGNYIKWLGIRIDEPNRIKVVEDQLDMFGGGKQVPRKKLPLRYLGQISDMTKQDIMGFWSTQSFDLGIPEELGNCVFCIKKGVNKVALAAKHEPEMAKQFIKMVSDERIPVSASRKSKGMAANVMYRNRMTLQNVIDAYSEISTKELSELVKRGRAYDTGSCSESCEAMNLDLFYGT